MVHRSTLPLASDETLLFLHIPKTAGTTLNALLDEQFTPSEGRELASWTDLPKYSIDYSPYRFLRGHVFFDIWKALPRRLRYMTLLRDPIERTLSNFEMMRRSTNDPWHHVVREMSIADFISHPLTQTLFVNTQTRLIGSSWPIASIDDIATAEEIVLPNILEVAKQRLDSFDFVGVTERFSESVELLFYTFGWYPRPILENLNRGPADRLKRDDLAPAVLRELSDKTSLDAELHRYAWRLFEQHREAMMHRLLVEHWQGSQVSSSSERASADFSGPWYGAGWYMRENHPQHGYYRWIGPDAAASLWLPVPRAEQVELRFRVIASCSEEILNTLTASVSGVPIKLSLEADPKGGIVFRGPVFLSRLAQQPPVVEVQWQLPYTRPPSSWDPGNPDPRRLGIALNLVELTPLK